jgi:hypothetical protein
VGGKALKFIDQYKALREAGLITHPKQLEKATLTNSNFKPPGNAVTKGGRQVYPHFG